MFVNHLGGLLMGTVWKKLGLKEQSPILILDLPENLLELAKDIQNEIHFKPATQYSFILFFCFSMEDAKNKVVEVMKLAQEKASIWLCYPKGSSNKYKSDINRDKSWSLFSRYDFEPVSLIAIDQDWSAIRFRQTDQISKMTRKTAASEKGKKRIKKDDD